MWGAAGHNAEAATRRLRRFACAGAAQRRGILFCLRRRLAPAARIAITADLSTDRDPNPMTDTPPDRLSVNPNSPFYDEQLLGRGVGVKFKGVDKTNVDEYCVSEGWVRLSVGTTVDRKGNPITIKLQGLVEPYFRDVIEG